MSPLSDNKRAAQRRWRERNKKALNAYARAWRRANPARHRNYQLKKTYGLTLAEWQTMHEAQKGRCAICRHLDEKLEVDHDHLSGKVRELLCRKCNVVLGFFNDSPELLTAALLYLERHK